MTPPPTAVTHSPSFTNRGAREGPAYELKFLLPSGDARRVEEWARRHLAADPNGDDGTYATATVYLDTAGRDVFHKSRGYRRKKYRLRRYGEDEVVHLERKSRRGDRVAKRRDVLPLDELPTLGGAGGGEWFGPRVRELGLGPACLVGYRRSAFVGPGLRLTLDRDLVGLPWREWALPARVDGRALLPGEAILELKFAAALPGLFRDLLGTLPSRPAGSKYARCVRDWGLDRG